MKNNLSSGFMDQVICIFEVTFRFEISFVVFICLNKPKTVSIKSESLVLLSFCFYVALCLIVLGLLSWKWLFLTRFF